MLYKKIRIIKNSNVANFHVWYPYSSNRFKAYLLYPWLNLNKQKYLLNFVLSVFLYKNSILLKILYIIWLALFLSSVVFDNESLLFLK